MRRRRNGYYEYPPAHRYSRYPARSRYRQEGCLDQVLRFFTTVLITMVMVALTVGSVIFLFTHFQQVVAFVHAIFAAISFIIAIFPRLLIVGGILLAVFAVLLVGYGLARLISAISRQLSLASLHRAQTAALKVKVKQEKERIKQSSVQVRREEVRLAKETFDYDQRVRDTYRQPRLDAQQSQGPHRTRVLQEVPQVPQVAQPQPQSTPAISQLLGNVIKVGQTAMLHGFEMINGNLTPVFDEVPVTAIIAGRGGSGKTRRIILMIFQAILIFFAAGAGYKVTICDPHWKKPDGLANVLAPFAPWLRFARTDNEIIAAAKDHIVEMESRLSATGSINGEGLMPRLIIIDEFGKLMKSEEISKKDKHILMKCVRETAVQWRGIHGHAWIAGQEFTQDAIGDTAIRKGAQAIFCHQLSDEYASFLFPKDARAQRLVQRIGRRECVFKDAENDVRRTATITVDDHEIDTMVAYLIRFVPRQVSRRRTQQISQQPQTQPMTPPLALQRAIPVQPGTQRRQTTAFHTRETEQLDPQQPSASSTWQDTNDGGRKHYGYNSSRPLHKMRLTAPTQGQMQALRTIEDVQTIKDADGSPDDTVLISEAELDRQMRAVPVPSRFPATDQLVPRQGVFVNDQEKIAFLAQMRQPSKKRC